MDKVPGSGVSFHHAIAQHDHRTVTGGLDRMTITYLVHDLADPAVARRVAMLQRGGGDIDLFGFRRSTAAPDRVAGVKARDLGQTQDGRFIARILSVAKARAIVGRWGRGF